MMMLRQKRKRGLKNCLFKQNLTQVQEASHTTAAVGAIEDQPTDIVGTISGTVGPPKWSNLLMKKLPKIQLALQGRLSLLLGVWLSISRPDS